jgi:hypothetical protein
MTVNNSPDIEENPRGKSRDALENSTTIKLHIVGTKLPTDVAKLPTALVFTMAFHPAGFEVLTPLEHMVDWILGAPPPMRSSFGR